MQIDTVGQSITFGQPPAWSASVAQTSCVVVGGGPAGAVLALLLARKGVAVTLLEAHNDFDREFRGDTLHPSVLEIIDQLGLADRLLEIPHTRLYEQAIETPQGRLVIGDFRRLKTRFPFIAMMPQSRFLEFITAEAARYPAFRLVMGARVEELIEEGGAVRGVRYRKGDGFHELRATLTVAADGRFSRVRKLAGLQPNQSAPALDVVWFKLPRRAGDPDQTLGRVSQGRVMVLINRLDYWQGGFVIAKGDFQRMREAGLPALRDSIAAALPEVADRVETLRSWNQISLLSVEAGRLPEWYRRGLLLIGDAAHTMSPIGGFGINMAIQDAVEAANVLTEPLRAGHVELEDLRAVQRKREWPTKFIQGYQAKRQRRMMRGLLDTSKPFKIPLIMRVLIRVPYVRDLPARLTAFGVGRARIRNL
jgi:2-polyprenyl-6-methoxyphenol hydroxylase-like FAD-dependent oxidoreductase